MAGVTHILSIAKEALLAHQLSVQVASHNIANVDTPGYTRQSLKLSANQPSLSSAGVLGGGVKGDMITRNYDRFMTQRISQQTSLMSGLGAQKDGLRVVEAIFNETQGFGVNDVMSQFWDSWQDLSNNPEILATRQTVVQMGQLISDQFQYMNSQVSTAKYDLGINLDAAIGDVNGLTSQIAALNVQIINSESENRTANDLRDQRDELVKNLSGLMDVSYFENSTGAYSVLLGDGHPLVELNESWKVDWSGNSLEWLSEDKFGNIIRSDLGSGIELGGKIGGWLEVRGQLVDDDPTNYLGKLNAFATSLIREVNQQHAQGVGMSSFDSEVIGKSLAANTAHLTSTVDAATAPILIPAGTFEINGRAVGQIEGGAAVNGLAMLKTANAVEAINAGLTGVTAKLTTLTAGAAVTGLAAPAAATGDTISFDIEGVSITHTVDLSGAPDDSVPATFAANLVSDINTTIAAYNALPSTANPVTVQAVVGDDSNGGVLNSIVLQNTNAGDESTIEIANLTSVAVSGTPLETNLGLTAGIYGADATHNTGELSLFSDQDFTVRAGFDDTYLDQLGMGGGLTPADVPGDGWFTYSYSDPGGITASLQGYKFADDLVTDGGSFDIWLYNTDGTLALAQPVNVSLERVYDLGDVVSAVNVAVSNASGGANWLTASNDSNRLKFTPDADHTFAFANDNSNILQVAGVNTYFDGYNAATISVNSDVADDLDLIAAATVTEHGEIFEGDNSNSLKITALQTEENVKFKGGVVSTFDGFYNALVSEVGTDTRTINRDFDYNTLVTSQMQEMRDSTSGVSLDEEMANLIKFQHAYTAAAKLISTADEMLTTLLQSVGV